ncbi:alpha/beta fold hydrolase [Agromyces aerolatus]|uniref:alpha/beta fold hydrolase n=1 Tax=Agromyces sp. LY-1074 TaxID=3074080 RepID=UPI0028618BCE|nr:MULTISPECIES: alpha/beta hydrolase [unclassified Agromyces]MDR5699635.1 alpha/beta hydrolase [Agromyces sp. LY-1074]MDR5705931.1 alpha/beta hydrolase [Agromyces sp. LY-1358]
MTDLFATHTDLTVAGGPVRLYRGGDTGPPLLLLHGAMLDTAQGVWRGVAAELSADSRVHLIDLPRHGGSRPWRGVLDDAFYGRFLDELLDALELERVALIGLSLGGGVATSYALRRPERVSALLAVGPGGLGAKRQAQFLTWLFMRTPGALRLTTRYLARRPEAIRKSMTANLVEGERTRDFDDILRLATEEAVAKERHGELALDDWQIHSYGPFSMRLNLLPELPRLAVPALWVRGDRDPLVGHAELAAAAEAAPGSRLVTMPDAGHIVTYDRPDEFTRLAREFLTSALDPRRS